MSTSRSSTPQTGFYKLPPIITTEADREFMSEVNMFVEFELNKINSSDEEQRYLIYKTVFNKIIEHVTAYKPILTQIKKEYEDTIETIKKGRREAAFLQGKLKAMASEPSTLRNYKKRADELEERMVLVRKDNEKLQQEIDQILSAKEEKEKRPKSAEQPERQLKKDSRMIPGLSIEESTDMKILQRKYESLDRQLKELNLSLRARFLPKTHKLQLKDSLDKKVAYRDQLLWQSQVYKMRGQRLKIALEAAQAYNQMKPPHQTVGDAVTLAFQQASGRLKAEREKVEGEQNETAQTTTFEDDDPNKEKEAEMMLEYIEKFNELFEDGLFEEAAVHAANSPKGILRTQATLAKFRDVKVKSRGRSPLLAFCDAIMASVKAAGSKPNEALSSDCMRAALIENRIDLAYHWLSQDRLTQSYDLGKMITDHCSCPVPCLCGCQALAQGVFTRLKCHPDIIFTFVKQGKLHGALQHARLQQCIDESNLSKLIQMCPQQELVNGLMEGDMSGKKQLLKINLGSVLLVLIELDKIDLASNLIQVMLKPEPKDADATTVILSLQMAVMLDTTTTPDQWMAVIDSLGHAGHQESMLQLLAMTTVIDIIKKAWKIAQEEKKGVSFSVEHQVQELDVEEAENLSESEQQDNGADSSFGMSSRSRDSNSVDHSSRETSPELSEPKKPVKESILKKRSQFAEPSQDAPSSSENSPRKLPGRTKKKTLRIARKKVSVQKQAAYDAEEDNQQDKETDDSDESDAPILEGEAEKQDAENEEAENQEAENQEAGKQDDENQKAEKQDDENQKAEKQDDENQKAENQKAEKQDDENQKAENQKAEKQDDEIQKAERQDDENQKAEKQDDENQKAEKQDDENQKAENQDESLQMGENVGKTEV